MADRICLQRTEGEMGLARRAFSRATCANPHRSTTGKGATRTTATSTTNAAGSRGSTAATPTKLTAAEHATPARFHVQFAEYGAEYVIACRAADSAASNHAAGPTTEAAIQRRRKTEQETTFWHIEPDLRQSRLQFTSTSLSGRVRCSELRIWTSSGRSMVELVAESSKAGTGGDSRFDLCTMCI